jgi:hypothetical protein
MFFCVVDPLALARDVRFHLRLRRPQLGLSRMLDGDNLCSCTNTRQSIMWDSRSELCMEFASAPIYFSTFQLGRIVTGGVGGRALFHIFGDLLTVFRLRISSAPN